MRVAGASSAFVGWCLGLVLISAPARACDLSETETGTVASIIDGETLKLGDGRVVRLIGAKAPMPPLGLSGDEPWPMVEEARDALTRLAAGKEVELRYGGAHTDRHGYALAQVYVLDGGARLWLQQEMVRQGYARVYSFPDNRACVKELLAEEADAREKGLGLWASPVYRVESAENVDRLGRLTKSYQLVEGSVLSVGEGGTRVYVNFASDWKSDFTVSVARKDVGAFLAAGIDLKELAGKRIRVRGLGHLAQRTHDRGHPSRADRGPRRCPKRGHVSASTAARAWTGHRFMGDGDALASLTARAKG